MAPASLAMRTFEMTLRTVLQLEVVSFKRTKLATLLCESLLDVSGVVTDLEAGRQPTSLGLSMVCTRACFVNLQ